MTRPGEELIDFLLVDYLLGELPPERLGVSAPDAQTVVIELEFPAAFFLPGAPGSLSMWL